MYRKLITSTAVLALTINLVAPAMADGFPSRVNRAVSQTAFAPSVAVKKHPGHSTSWKAKYQKTARSLARVNAPKRTLSRSVRATTVPVKIATTPLRAGRAAIKCTLALGDCGATVGKAGYKGAKKVGRVVAKTGKSVGRGAVRVGKGVGRGGKLLVNTAVNRVKSTVGCALALGNCVVRTKNTAVKIGKIAGRGVVIGGKRVGRGAVRVVKGAGRGGKAAVKCTLALGKCAPKVAKAVAKSTKKVGRGIKKSAKTVGRGAKKVAKKLKFW